MQVKRIQNPGDLAPILEQIDSNAESMKFLLFFGTEDPQTGQSWCPDCVVADPRVRKHLLAAEAASGRSVMLFECPVGLKSEWRQSPEHFYKQNPQLKIERIPTLIRWHRGESIGRLVEDECLDDAKFQSLLK